MVFHPEFSMITKQKVDMPGLSASESSAVASPATRSTAMLKPLVLLVDGDINFQESLRTLLQRHGYHVLQAYDFLEVRALLEYADPEFLVVSGSFLVVEAERFHQLVASHPVGTQPLYVVVDSEDRNPSEWGPIRPIFVSTKKGVEELSRTLAELLSTSHRGIPHIKGGSVVTPSNDL